MVLRYSDFAEKASKQSSEREIIAMQIERKEMCIRDRLFREHKLAEVSFFGPCRPMMSLIEQQIWLCLLYTSRCV